jgi:hypothetical protein
MKKNNENNRQQTKEAIIRYNLQKFTKIAGKPENNNQKLEGRS